MIPRPRLRLTGQTCAHCSGPQNGSASVTQYDDARKPVHKPLCHPDYGMDCYSLVSVYGHSMPCQCRGASEHPDQDVCHRCEYRRFEHVVDVDAPDVRLDFLGNPVPCFDFQPCPVLAPQVPF